MLSQRLVVVIQGWGFGEFKPLGLCIRLFSFLCLVYIYTFDDGLKDSVFGFITYGCCWDSLGDVFWGVLKS